MKAHERSIQGTPEGGRRRNYSCAKNKIKKLRLTLFRSILTNTPRKGGAMEKVIKIIGIAAVVAAFVYAQTADTVAAKDSTQPISAVSIPASAANVKKATTGTRPAKPPTNWSKIKDLFL
jgi:hypothetical protein